MRPSGMLPRGRQSGHQLHHGCARHVRRADDADLEWTKPGVYTVEEFNPDPFLNALDKYGLPRSENHNPVLVD